MKPFGPFPLTQDESQNVPLDLTPVVDVLVVKNASPFVLEIQSYQGGIHKILPFWADLISAPDFQGTLTVLPAVGLSSANPPMQSLLVDAYGRGEQVLGSYPAPLAYQFNLGNNVPLNAQATSVANDGNAAATTVVESTVSGHSASDYLQTNDGAVRLASIFKSKGGGASFWSLYGWDGSADHEGLRVQTDGTLLAIQSIAFFPFTTFIKACNRFSGTGSGTFSHGLGTTPTAVFVVQSTVGSQTMGWDTPTSTTVHITAGNGAAWVAFAYAT